MGVRGRLIPPEELLAAPGVTRDALVDSRQAKPLMCGLNKALRESGEFVSAEGLGSPHEAKVVRAGKDGVPITDGVFPEAKEFLAGCWIVEVKSPEQAYAIAARASAAPGPGGVPINIPIEVRQVMSGPPDEFL